MPANSIAIVSFLAPVFSLLSSVAMADPPNPDQRQATVRLSLRSTQSVPIIVAPNAVVQWQLVAEVSTDNLGLAGAFCSITECDVYPSGSDWPVHEHRPGQERARRQV